MGEDLLTIDEARALVRVDRSTFFALIRPTIRVVRVGRRVFVRRDDLARWLDEHTQEPAQGGGHRAG